LGLKNCLLWLASNTDSSEKLGSQTWATSTQQIRTSLGNIQRHIRFMGRLSCFLRNCLQVSCFWLGTRLKWYSMRPWYHQEKKIFFFP
jgi:hypothetical protein